MAATVAFPVSFTGLLYVNHISSIICPDAASALVNCRVGGTDNVLRAGINVCESSMT